MTKITMPDPVAWGVYDPTIRTWGLSKERVETKHREDGTVVYVAVPFITTTQAEAYADARVREALEEAAKICWEMQSAPEFGKDDKDHWLSIAERRIRALIPPTEWPKEVMPHGTNTSIQT